MTSSRRRGPPETIAAEAPEPQPSLVEQSVLARLRVRSRAEQMARHVARFGAAGLAAEAVLGAPGRAFREYEWSPAQIISKAPKAAVPCPACAAPASACRPSAGR